MGLLGWSPSAEVPLELSVGATESSRQVAPAPLTPLPTAHRSLVATTIAHSPFPLFTLRHAKKYRSAKSPICRALGSVDSA